MLSLMMLCAYPKSVQTKKPQKIVVQPIHKDAFLEKAVNGLLANNQELISLQHKLRSALYEYNKARGNLLPKIDLVAEANRNYKRDVPDASPLSALTGKGNNQNTYQNALGYGAELAHVLFDGFSTFNSVRAKDDETKTQIYAFMAQFAKKIVELVDLILNIQEAELRIEIAKRDIDRKSKMLTQATHRVDAGSVGKDNVLQAQAASDEARSSLNKAEADLSSAKLNFLQWTGMPYTHTAWIGFPEDPLKNLDALEKTLDQKNYSVLQAKAEMDQRKKEKTAVDGKLFAPTINLRCSAKNLTPQGYTDDRVTNNRTNNPKYMYTDLNIGIEGRINVFHGGSDKAEALGAGERAKSARRGFYAAVQEAKIAFNTAKEQFLSADRNNALFLSSSKSFTESYNIFFDQYQNGATNFQDLSSIANSLNSAELNLVRNEKERRSAAWKLLLAAGLINSKTMCYSAGKDFDPFSEYNQIKSYI